MLCIWVYMCVYVNGCMFVWVHGLGCVLQCSDLFGEIRTVVGDSDSCSQMTRYTGDSKTDPWDDPKIHTSSCSGDHMVIRFWNHVISCQWLFIGLFQFQYFILMFHAHVYIILYYSVHVGHYWYIAMLWYYFINILLLCYQQYCRFISLF